MIRLFHLAGALLPAAILAQSIIPVPRFEKEFRIVCEPENGDCSVLYRGRTIMEATATGGSPELSFLRFEPRDREVYLLSVPNGDGCPAVFHVLEVGRSSAFASPGFGNCNDPEIRLYADRITFDFPGWAELRRQRARYVYRGRRLFRSHE